ncbi:MAG: FtsX-like permease family protein [Anaerolineales bacterium]|nr:FtsX-like permease family protein [Anaerolineales bacterium]
MNTQLALFETRSATSPVTQVLRRLFGLVHFALRRQIHHPALTLLALFGIVLSVGMINHASIFAEAVDKTILDETLSAFSRQTGRPAFSTAVYTHPSAREPMTLEQAEEIGEFVASTVAAEVGLPLTHTGIEIHSGAMMMRAREGSGLYTEGQSTLGYADLVYIANVSDHITIVAGDPLDDAQSGEALDVWMHSRMAEKMGLHVGEELDIGATMLDNPTPIRVRGFWEATDREDPFWFTDPDFTFKESLLVRRQDYLTYLQPIIPAKVRAVNWHMILDQGEVIPANARNYVDGFGRSLSIINRYLPDARLNTPPLDPLQNFVQRETALTTLLLAFNVPGFGFLLYFLILASTIIARWQQHETTILVSRGMGRGEILVLTLIEELLLFVIGYPIGIAVSMGLARAMGYTASFLTFTERAPLPVSLRGVSTLLTFVALGIALIARLWPAAMSARTSVVEAEQERSRPVRAPFWYRFYLDILLVLPTVYAYDQLAKQGTIALLVQDRAEDLYQDPLLILVPALFVLTASLMAMRLFSLLTWLIDHLAGVVRSTSLYLALRQLGRQSSSYISPLLLIIIALALGVYTLSMAGSLDQWLVDRVYYRVGADLTFAPYPSNAEDAVPFDGSWVPMPQEFDNIPGVQAATRFGDYPASIKLSDRRDARGRFLAIDRLYFPGVAWLRSDLTKESLGAMMNQLALQPDGVLVSQLFLDETQNRVGDQIRLTVKVHDSIELDTLLTIVGAYDTYFPTVYEEVAPAVIGNLDYLVSLAGFTPAHDIWIRLEEGVQGQDVLDALPGLGVPEVSSVRDSRALIAEEQGQLERVGIFGTLSVGFAAAVIVAVFGLIIYTQASLRERLHRLTALRAMGMSRRQVVVQVVIEYVLLLLFGTIAGAGIGTAASQLFLPFMTVTTQASVPLPPLLPMIAHAQVAYLMAAFAGGMILLEAIVIARALAQRNFDMLRLLAG